MKQEKYKVEWNNGISVDVPYDEAKSAVFRFVEKNKPELVDRALKEWVKRKVNANYGVEESRVEPEVVLKVKPVKMKGKRKSDRWSKEETDRFIRLVSDGVSLDSLEKEFGRTRWALYSKMKKLGISVGSGTLKKRSFTATEIAKIEELNNAGYDYKEIAKLINRNENSVYGKIRSMGRIPSTLAKESDLEVLPPVPPEPVKGSLVDGLRKLRGKK